MRLPSAPWVAAALAVACHLASAAPADAQACNGRTLVNRGAVQPTNAATQTVSGSIPSGTGDYYVVAVNEAGSYTFTFCVPGSSSFDSWLCILDSGFAVLQQNDDTCGLQAQIVRALTPGTYYICVSGYSTSSSGTYTLAYSATVTNAGPSPAIYNPLPASGGWVTTATPTLSAFVVGSAGSTNVHAEFDVDGAGYVDGSVVSTGQTSTLVTATLAEGAHAWVARAHDSAGLFSAATASRTFNVDLTDPLPGSVNDGTGADIDWQTSTSTISANWSGFSDPQSALTYAWAIGTAPLGTTIQSYVSVGSATSASTNALALTGNGPFFVTVRATNAAGRQTFVSSDGVTLLTGIHAAALATATVGQAYADALTATFGTGPYTWAVQAGSIPPGITLGSDGAISGTPVAAGTYVFGAAAQDSLAVVRRFSYKIVVQSANGALVITAGNPATVTSLPAGRLSISYSQTLTATGGQTPYIWRIASGLIPPGLTLDSLTGVLSGFPSRVGVFTFMLAAADVDHPTQESTALLSIAVTGTPTALSILSAATFPAGRTGGPYVALASATGGTAPYSWLVTAGALPDGLTLDPEGVILGTPTSTANATFTLTVTDGASASATLAASMTVTDGAGPLTIEPATMALAAQGLAYPVAFTAEGGTSGYAWSVTSGSLPPGMTLDAPTGTLTGAPSASGLFRFVVTAVDSGSTVSTASVLRELNVLRTASGGYVIVTPSPLPDAPLGAPYSLPMAVVGGTGPHAWSLFNGSLPPGLTLNANTGEIAGTPSAAGTSVFAVEASASAGILSSVRVYSVTVPGFPPGGGGGGCGFLGPEAAALLLLMSALRRRRKV